MAELYDYDTLISGRESIVANIEAIEIALNAEREKLNEYNKQIAKAEAILEMHGELPKNKNEG
jgi:hypothetical protein